MNSTKEKIRQVLLERIFSFVLLSKRSFDGCCVAKSSRELFLRTKSPVEKDFSFPLRSSLWNNEVNPVVNYFL
jgi:hypothetical protein